jgi:hypothetical protein
MVKGGHRLQAILVYLIFAWSLSAQAQAAEHSTTVRLSTVCASPKSVPPPPAEGGNYRVASYPDAKLYRKIVGILEAAKQPDLQQQFAKVPIAAERRAATLSQLAIWMEIGKQTGGPANQITRNEIKTDLLKAAKIPLDSLSAEQVKSLNQGVDAIFMAADLTRKEGLSTAASLKTPDKSRTGKSLDPKTSPDARPAEPGKPQTDTGSQPSTGDGTARSDTASPGSSASPDGISAPDSSTSPDGTATASVPVVSLEDAVRNGDVSFTLVGDGVSTSHVDLVLVNNTAGPLRVSIPAYTAFLPDGANCQAMISTTDEIADVPGNEQIAQEPPGVPATPKDEPPGPAPAPEESPKPITTTAERPPGPGTTPRPASRGLLEALSDPAPAVLAPAMKPPCPCIVTLYWLPVTSMGLRIAKAFGLVGGYPILDAFKTVYHAALRIQIPDGDDCKNYVIELTTHVDPEENPEEAKRVGQLMEQKAAFDLATVGGIRLYPGGEITDESTTFVHGKVDCDCAAVHKIKELMQNRQVPAYSYGDVVGIQEDRWTSNALISYLLTSVGCDVPWLLIPPDGEAPGWDAGVEAALTKLSTGKFPGGVRMMTPPFAEGFPGMSYEPQAHAGSGPAGSSSQGYTGSIWSAF